MGKSYSVNNLKNCGHECVFTRESSNMKYPIHKKRLCTAHAPNRKSGLHNTDVLKCGNDSKIALLYVTVEGLRDFSCCVQVCYKLTAKNITLPYIQHRMKEKINPSEKLFSGYCFLASCFGNAFLYFVPQTWTLSFL